MTRFSPSDTSRSSVSEWLGNMQEEIVEMALHDDYSSKRWVLLTLESIYDAGMAAGKSTGALDA